MRPEQSQPSIKYFVDVLRFPHVHSVHIREDPLDEQHLVEVVFPDCKDLSKEGHRVGDRILGQVEQLCMDVLITDLTKHQRCE